MGEPLTDEQIAQEEAFLEGIPRLNIAALLLPPVWGPANGFWIAILFYPAWIFADNCIFSAYSTHKVSSIIFALIAVVAMVVVTVVFSLLGQPIAAHRAAERGKSKEEYLKRQRVWAICSAVAAVVIVALATYYNLVIRAPLS